MIDKLLFQRRPDFTQCLEILKSVKSVGDFETHFVDALQFVSSSRWDALQMNTEAWVKTLPMIENFPKAIQRIVLRLLNGSLVQLSRKRPSTVFLHFMEELVDVVFGLWVHKQFLFKGDMQQLFLVFQTLRSITKLRHSWAGGRRQRQKARKITNAMRPQWAHCLARSGPVKSPEGSQAVFEMICGQVVGLLGPWPAFRNSVTVIYQTTHWGPRCPEPCSYVGQAAIWRPAKKIRRPLLSYQRALRGLLAVSSATKTKDGRI